MFSWFCVFEEAYATRPSSSADGEHFPEEYERPIARATHLLEPSAESTVRVETPEMAETDTKAVPSEVAEDVKESVSFMST